MGDPFLGAWVGVVVADALTVLVRPMPVEIIDSLGVQPGEFVSSGQDGVLVNDHLCGFGGHRGGPFGRSANSSGSRLLARAAQRLGWPGQMTAEAGLVRTATV